MTLCPRDDNVRYPIRRTVDSVTWHCSWCRSESVEQVETSDTQEES